MKIATFNIDWARKAKSQNHYRKIESFLNETNFDFLIITEGIKLSLQNYPFRYFTEKIPENQEYEGLNYSAYLNGEKAFRTIIYSKFPAYKFYPVSDPKTSIAIEFVTPMGELVIYGTIIGTWFKKEPFARKELQNCMNDCKNIYNQNPNLILTGDLNTSFLKNEKVFSIHHNTTDSLLQLFKNLNLINVTQCLPENIDHIIIPLSFENKLKKSEIFIEKNILSDHQGVFIELS